MRNLVFVYMELAKKKFNYKVDNKLFNEPKIKRLRYP